MARLMAREWARKGINVNVIEPGYFPTEITGELMESELGDALLKTFPRRRWCEIPAMDVPLLYLCSDLSRYVTGSTITVDDGQLL
jgi:NAD(P)-dependent dehydrogenase (short-subunit alcohol dehydrogenase family)